MKIITVALQKGGTGKTSTSVSLAVELSKKGKTILIDADPQGNATTWLDIQTMQFDFADLLLGKCEMNQCICQTAIENLSIVPTAGIGGELKDFCENSAGGKQGKIKKTIKEIARNYDYCVVDTSPSFGNFEKSIFLATNEIIAVLQLDEFSKDGLQIFNDRLKTFLDENLEEDEAKPNFNKIVFNAKDERISQQTIILEQFKPLEAHNFKLYIIPVDQAYRKAQTVHIPIQEYAKTKPETLKTLSKLAEDLK